MTFPLTLASRVRISKDVLFQDLDGEVILLDLATGVYFGLDPVGTRIWHLLEQGQSLGSIAEMLVVEYDVTEARCADDVRGLVARLLERGLVEIGDRPRA